MDSTSIKNLLFGFLALVSATLIGCKDDDAPEDENEEEIITKVRLIFNPEMGTPLTFLATDPDGEGPEDLSVEGAISLAPNTVYELFIELDNELAGESITEEVEEEGDEHLFLFGFTEGLFANPLGDGNLDGRAADAVDYLDEDVQGLPLGLITRWRTGEATSGTFRVVLKHQPDLKTETSSLQDGETDIDITWNLVVE